MFCRIKEGLFRQGVIIYPFLRSTKPGTTTAKRGKGVGATREEDGGAKAASERNVNFIRTPTVWW